MPKSAAISCARNVNGGVVVNPEGWVAFAVFSAATPMLRAVAVGSRMARPV